MMPRMFLTTAFVAIGMLSMSAPAQTIEVGFILEAFDGCGCQPLNPPNCPAPHDLKWPFREDWWTYQLNTSGPTVVGEAPARRSSISSLSTVQVTFSESVTGVTANLLEVNGSAATTVSGSGAGPYDFSGFAGPADGVVRVRLSPGTISGASGAFGGAYWTYQKNRPDWVTLASAAPAIDSAISSLSSVQVTFSEAVTGVLPGHLRVGGSSATAVSGSGAGPYEFTGFAPPADGVVLVELRWRTSLGIIYAEAGSGCNVHDASTNLPHPTYCGMSGLPWPFPNYDAHGAGEQNLDQDWWNQGYPVDYFASYAIKNGVEPANQASQGFHFLLGNPVGDRFSGIESANFGYINPLNPQRGIQGFGRMLVRQMLDDYNTLHPDAPLPTPVSGPVWFAFDALRNGDGFGGTDPGSPLLAMRADLIGTDYQSVPSTLTWTGAPESERMIPNDNQWHTYRILQASDYPEEVYMGIGIRLDASSQQPYPAIMSEDVNVYIDNLRIIYQALPLPEVCGNGVDDDADTLVDCVDPDCYFSPNCPCDPYVAFDVDHDGDVDQADFSVLQACVPGTPGSLLSGVCDCLDITGPEGNKDGSLDQQDFVAFELCASGPGVAADQACDD